MMDMRAFSKGYLSYFDRARERYGVLYRSRISALYEGTRSNDIFLRYMNENGEMQDERFDLVVLSIGMEISESVRDLGRRLGVELDEYGFCQTVQFNPLETSRKGIYAIGPFREPKDIPESVVEGSAAAGSVAAGLSPARFALTVEREYPEERNVSEEAPRVGVFVCSCGSNIGGFVDVPAVTEYAASLPYVAHAEANLYTCSQDSIKHITEQVLEHKLNRVEVASSTPPTHQPLFQHSIRMAAEPVFVRDGKHPQSRSWVH